MDILVNSHSENENSPTIQEIFINIVSDSTPNYHSLSHEERVNLQRNLVNGILDVLKDFKTLAEKIKSLGPYRKIKSCDSLLKSNEICTICQNSYKMGEYKRELVCNHTFHKKCIDKWFKKNHNTCPICRYQVFH